MHHKDLVYVLSSFKFTLTSIQIIEYPLLNSSWYFSLFSMLKLQLMIIKLPFKNKSKFQLIQIWIRVKTFYFQEMKMTKLFHSHAYVYNIIYIYIYIYICIYIYIFLSLLVHNIQNSGHFWPNFAYNSRQGFKNFKNWPNFIVWLPLLCEILGNTCIEIVC